MAFRHRKLANDSAIDPIKFCKENCDTIKYPDSNCKGACLWCPPVCDTTPPAVVFTASPEPPHRISLLLTVSLSALAAVFFLFTCYTIYKFYSHWCSPGSRRRRSRRQDSAAADPDGFLGQDPAADHHVWYIRTVGLQPSVIGAITIVKYKKADGLIDGSDCSVCLSEFQEDETLRLLPKCNHAFHVACIDTWLGSHTNCPMCRAGIISSQEEEEEQIAQNLAPVEEGAASGGNRRDSENEQRVGNEDRGIGLLLDGIQPLRRSISVGSIAVVGKSDNRSVVGVKDCESGVVVARRSGLNQGSTFSMKRSLSCSANVFLSKHSSRNRT